MNNQLLAAQRRPAAIAGKRTCDMKMVQIAFGDNLPMETKEDQNIENEAPPKFLGNGKFGMI